MEGPPPPTRLRVADARVARLATLASDGRPHLVPCTFCQDGERVFTAVDAKPKTTMALRRLDNIRADPRVSLLVDHYEEDWSALWWVRLDGSARVLDTGSERQRALELLAAKYEQYRVSPPPGAVIEVQIERWRTWR